MRRSMILLVLAALLSITACTVSSGGSGDSGSSASAAPPATSQPSTQPATEQVSTSSSTTSGPQKSSEPDLAAREQRLDAQSGGQPHVVVTVPGGLEAATYDQHGDIHFWTNRGDGADWERVGGSNYPSSEALGPPNATTSGALLTGMRHATFIVRGLFTGDSSGNAVAFTTGAKGWGAITAESNGNIGPSGRPVGADLVGLSYDFAFVGGHLQTKDCPQNRAIAECGRFPVTKTWDWTGHDFEVR